MKFTEFNLHQDLLKGIEKSGYVDCTPVQEQVIKAALDGSDLYVQSQTGTGKTAAFLTTIIQEMLTSNDGSQTKKALILVPTRELAVQVEEEAKYLASGTQLKCASFYGGVGYKKQTNSLKKDLDFIIGTPGRIIDLQEQGIMDLSGISYIVIDEADRMFDMGFYPELRKILKCVPSSENRQTMLFSATLNTYVKNLAWEYTREPKEIEIASENITVDEIDQHLFHVSSDEKMKLLVGIIKNENPESLIIFCNTKKSCEIVSKRLKINEIESEYIIGDLPQSKRLQVLNSFKNGTLKIMVATDVAARGIDVQDLAMVINYDLPVEAENYVHRIGRTARAGKSGKAYTFCSEQDVYNLPAIERYIEKSIPSSVAYPEQMLEDKSEGVYIKLDRYEAEGKKTYENKNGHRENKNNHRENNKTYENKGNHKKSYNKKPYNKNDYKKTDSNKKNYTKQKYANDEMDLSNLSFDERMKIYKQRYSSQVVPQQKTETKKQGFLEKLKSLFGKKKQGK